MDILSGIKTRRSNRAFLPKPVDKNIITAILDAARFSPSGVNMQPWRVSVLQGATKDKLTKLLLAERQKGDPEKPDYQYYPTEWFSPYQERRKECGRALYEALHIEMHDKAARMQAWNNNYHFFNAPVGLLVWVDSRLALGSWVDVGIFVNSILIGARHFDLHTCPQASLAEYPHVARTLLNVEPHWHLVCGIALGYGDEQAPVNQYRLERLAVDEFTEWFE